MLCQMRNNAVPLMLCCSKKLKCKQTKELPKANMRNLHNKQVKIAKMHIFDFKIALLAAILTIPITVSQNPKPNIIIIIADDLGFNDVSFHGSDQIPTPNIDALASTGVILNQYYVSPICTPSRSALFSGIHPIHTGMQNNVIYGATPYGLPLKLKLLPEFLKDLGYSTHLVGKWHLGHFSRNYTPTRRGFDSFFGHWTGHKDYYDNTAQESNPQAWGYDLRRGEDVTFDGFGRYTTDVFTDEAIDVIHAHAHGNRVMRHSNGSTPLFLVVSHTAVHSANPYALLQAPEETIAKFAYIDDVERRKFAAMVSKLDDSVGAVVAALASTALLADSVIVFTSDNGGPAAGFNGNAASNWPLRGVKNTLWEGGVRAAGFLWSTRLPLPRRGTVSKQLIHIQDWLPTLVQGAAEGTGPPPGAIDGINLWDALLSGVESPRTELLHNIDDIYGNEGVRHGKWKLLHGTTYGGRWDGWYGPSGDALTSSLHSTPAPTPLAVAEVFSSAAGRALRSIRIREPSENEWVDLRAAARIVCHAPVPASDDGNETLPSTACALASGDWCLFDILADPCEYENLAPEHPEVVENLKQILTRYRATAVTPRNAHKDPRGQPKFWNYTWTNWCDFLDEGCEI